MAHAVTALLTLFERSERLEIDRKGCERLYRGELEYPDQPVDR